MAAVFYARGLGAMSMGRRMAYGHFLDEVVILGKCKSGPSVPVVIQIVCSLQLGHMYLRTIQTRGNRDYSVYGTVRLRIIEVRARYRYQGNAYTYTYTYHLLFDIQGPGI